MLTRIITTLAFGALAVANPVLANEGSAAGGATDVEFGALFESWEELEGPDTVMDSAAAMAVAPVAARVGVSVPSRMPVDDVTLTSGYGMRNHPVLNRRARHNGVDLAAPTGTPVYATADGTIEMAQWYSSYGNYVQIAHGGDLETRYAHLSSYTVNPGETVRQGDLIGYVGSTGRSTGPHLHYEVRVGSQPVNPIPYMTAQLDTDYGANAARGGPETE